jgi:hypothetical protein
MVHPSGTLQWENTFATPKCNDCFCDYVFYRAYKADIKMVVDANFDGVKIDNCGDDQGIGYIAR